MSPVAQSLLVLSFLGALAASPALAASSASSAASEGASTSVGSSSTSIEQSSNSSSKGDKVAAGDYRIVEIVAAAEQPGKVRLKLRALQGEEAFVLVVTQAAAEQGRLAAGGLVTAKTRDYGTEFSVTDTQQPFFLVLHDAWRQELRTRPVTI
jgi:hypothetical protein